MEIGMLREFLQLAKSLNYTMAADMLFMSRSTLSKHIKQLEEELGVELFERTTKQVKLTRQGEVLRERAYNIMREYETALIELDGSRTVSGALRVAGCTRFPVINQVINAEVTKFERDYPDVDIMLDDIFARDYRDMLVDGSYDVVCSFRLPGLNEEGLHFVPLIDMQICAWVSPRGPLAQRESLTYEELSNYVIRYMEPRRSRLLTSYYRTIFDQRGLDIHTGKPLSPTLFMAPDEFALFPYVDAPRESLPDIVQVPIEETVSLPVCWVRKRKTVNPLVDMFFAQVVEER